jgi:phosphopantothenoylcysteine decarboxylase/phosphopantothenate--cysteine ligase
VEYGLWADLMLIAPASANTLSKMANGACDNMLLAVYLSARCPVMIAPAMDEDMWKHKATQRNIETLRSYKHHVLDVNNGELASGLIGPGRMAEPEELLQALENFFSSKKKIKPFKALVCLGPTIENIDAVRFISNHSSGKMGIALAEALLEHGADVDLICGPIKEKLPAVNQIKWVYSANDMYRAVLEDADKYRLIIMAAAVADYTVANPELDKKIKKNDETLTITLTKTKDILAALGSNKKEGQVIVGFALEKENEFQHAQEKLSKKNADYIILNSLNDEGSGFGTDTNQVTIFSQKHKPLTLPLQSKSELSKKIIEHLLAHENL